MSDAHFNLLDLENNTEIFVPEGSNFRIIVHAKALLILNWQQEEEMESQIPYNLTLKLIVNWMNCSSWDPFLHHLPEEYFNISKNGESLNLQDFDCVPDSFRNWCVADPGRVLSFNYVLEKYLGHTVEMKFVCDPGIAEIHEDLGFYEVYGVMLAVVIIMGMMGISKVRKDRARSAYQKLLDAPEPPEAQNALPEQDRNFLTVPPRVRIRTQNSGELMMAARKTFEPKPTVIPEFLKLDRRKEKFRIPKEKIPKIYLFEPED